MSFIQNVFNWMFGGLLLTGITAYFVSRSESLINLFMTNIWFFYSLLILELVLVIYLSAMVKKVSSTTASIIFLLYAFLNGVTFSLIFVVYTQSSIALTFFVTAGMFGLTALYGYVTKRDLTTVGSIAIMALFGLILASISNIFLNNETIYWVTTYAGILIFVALTAYDMQKIKEIDLAGNDGTDDHKKEAIMGALTLYLDFINLFIKLLRIFGKRK